MVGIPADVIPLRDLGLSTRIRRLASRALGPRALRPKTFGRTIPSHCLSVLALRLITAAGAPIDLYRALLCRHRCQSSINTVTRSRAEGLNRGFKNRLNQTGLQR